MFFKFQHNFFRWNKGWNTSYLFWEYKCYHHDQFVILLTDFKIFCHHDCHALNFTRTRVQIYVQTSTYPPPYYVVVQEVQFQTYLFPWSRASSRLIFVQGIWCQVEQVSQHTELQSAPTCSSHTPQGINLDYTGLTTKDET